jgi:hypothetical protein
LATLVLSAVGGIFGGPLGRGLGALIGNQIDRLIFKPSSGEGPRLKELPVTTSSYGMPIARHFGTMRAAGSIIWANDIAESSEKVGGAKGSPSTKTYSYSASFAVVLASRPIASVGRIWADGNLLCGAGGDLKVSGQFRLYTGYGDQLPDPLLASSEGAGCPAFRGRAYCVFEALQLTDFGNRIPALTFEIIAESGEVQLHDVLGPLDGVTQIDRQLGGLLGYSDEGGPVRDALAGLAQVYPLACDASGEALSLFATDAAGGPTTMLPEAVIDRDGESFGGPVGHSNQHSAALRNVPSGIRYYDVNRDYQPSLQRAGGQGRAGRDFIAEFPGALAAGDARGLAEQAAERQSWSQDRLNWRIAELDPSLRPGSIVRVPDRQGRWRIESWEWRENGLELELLRQPNARRASAPGDPGRSLPTADLPVTTTQLLAFELPWDGLGSSEVRQVFAAGSSASSGWTGAMLYVDRAGGLVPLIGTGNRRSIIGSTITALAPGDPHLVDRSSVFDVQLASPDFVLNSRLIEDLAQGANRALVGAEIIQFASAEALGNGLWRIRGILRGRGGTEHHALLAQAPGKSFALLDDRTVSLDGNEIGPATAIAAIGLADIGAVNAEIAGVGSTLRPLTPVHPRARLAADGSLDLSWTRRARGAWSWSGTVEPPLAEQSERYEVGLGNPDQPAASWEVVTPQLSVGAAVRAQLQAQHPGALLWVRQIGSFARSQPLLLTSIS